jgi:hypothetical protein
MVDSRNLRKRNKKRTRKATFVTTLVYLDEPQLVLLSMKENVRIIAVAIHNDEEFGYPFFGAQINEFQFQKYMRGFVDLRFLFSYPKYKRWYIFDLGESDGDEIELEEIDTSIIQNNYLPSSGFFSRDHTESYGIELAQFSTQTFFIDGAWNLQDFSRFYGKYNDIYSLLMSLNKYRSTNVDNKTKRRIVDAFVEYPWKGGGSYLNFYGDLSGVQDFGDQLSMGSIQYASPGHVDIQGNEFIFKLVNFAIENYEENHYVIIDRYRKLHEYLRKLKLLKTSSDRFDNSSSTAVYIQKESRILAELLLINEFEDIFGLVDKNALAAAKIVLSYCRRMDSVFRFFAEGRIKFGELRS